MSEKQNEKNVEKINKAFEQLISFDTFFEKLGNVFELAEKALEPAYNMAQKIEKVVEKVEFIGNIFLRAQEIAPIFKKITGQELNFSI